MIMSSEILMYESLGSPEEIVFILKNVLSSKPIRIRDIEAFCLNSLQYPRIPTLGILALLQYLKVVDKEENGIKLNEAGNKLLVEIETVNDTKSVLMKYTLAKLLEDEDFIDFLDMSQVKYNPSIDSYAILNSSFQLKYSPVRNFLVRLEFLKVSPLSQNLFLIDGNALLAFDYQIKHSYKQLSLRRLKERQEALELQGKKAEEFVFQFELKRLEAHPFKNRIKRISEIDVSAGYDIYSFESADSNTPRLIEVKSYYDKLGFYWSENEVGISKDKKEYYCIYLVDMNKIRFDDYRPLIINNPYDKVFSNNPDWVKSCTNWYITKL